MLSQPITATVHSLFPVKVHGVQHPGSICPVPPKLLHNLHSHPAAAAAAAAAAGVWQWQSKAVLHLKFAGRSAAFADCGKHSGTCVTAIKSQVVQEG
jgi:hypothetical protein